MARYRKTKRWDRTPKKERVPGTPRQEAWRKRCWAVFCGWCEENSWSKRYGREIIADKMGIEPYQADIYEMDETELITVAEICNGEFVELSTPSAPARKGGYAKGGADIDPDVPF